MVYPLTWTGLPPPEVPTEAPPPATYKVIRSVHSIRPGKHGAHGGKGTSLATGATVREGAALCVSISQAAEG